MVVVVVVVVVVVGCGGSLTPAVDSIIIVQDPSTSSGCTPRPKFRTHDQRSRSAYKRPSAL